MACNAFPQCEDMVFEDEPTTRAVFYGRSHGKASDGAPRTSIQPLWRTRIDSYVQEWSDRQTGVRHGS